MMNIQPNSSTETVRFEELVKTLSRMITKRQLAQIKRVLPGHMDRNTISQIHGPDSLLFYLRYKKLLSAKKLAFLMKLLQTVDGKDNVLSVIESFKNLSVAEKQKSENAPVGNKQDIKALMIIEDRQLTSMQECQAMLDKLDLTYKEFDRARMDTNEKIKGLLEQHQELELKKEGRLSKYRSAQTSLENKQLQIASDEEAVATLKTECEHLRNNLNELNAKQKMKGEQRLNAFQKTLERDQILNVEKSIYSVKRKTIEHKDIIMEREYEYNSLVKDVDFRRTKLRDVVSEKTQLNDTRFAIHNELEALQRKILEVMDETAYYRLSMVEIEYELEETRASIKFKERPETALVEGREPSTAEITEMLKKSKLTINYEVLGPGYVLTQLHTNSTPIKLHRPFSVIVDRNGDIVVIDGGGSKRVAADYRVVNFTPTGEFNFVIQLNTLKPTDIKVDNANNYIISGQSLIRIYRRVDLTLQFVPYFNPKTMELPKIAAVEFNPYGEEILLLDGKNKSVQAFDMEGQHLYNTDISEFVITPSCLHMLNRHTLVITDAAKHCVIVCKFLAQNVQSHVSHGVYGIGVGEYVGPSSICSDSSGNILVGDAGNHRVCILESTTGEHLMSFGRFGTSRGSFRTPVDVALHSKYGAVFIADKENDRIVVYL